MSALLKGVDFSGDRDGVNIKALKAAGVEFVLIRCGYGSNYNTQDDEHFVKYVNDAKAAGLPYGVWLYSYAMEVNQAYSEAEHVLRLLKKVDKPAFGVWYDMEDGDHYKEKRGMPSNQALVQMCDIFCQEVQKAGYYCGIYANLDWFENRLNSPVLDKYDKWVAQYNNECQYKKPYGIWQFTNAWWISGQKFDGNYAYKNYPAITKAKAAGTGDNPSLWHKEATEWAKQQGIFQGDGKGNFDWQGPLTREQAAQILFNMEHREKR